MDLPGSLQPCRLTIMCDQPVWYLVLILLTLNIPAVEMNTGYLVVSPATFRSGREEVLSVTILKPSKPIHVQANLYCLGGELVAEAGHEIFGKGSLKIKIPKHAKGRCNLKICGNCLGPGPKEGAYTFYNSSIVMVEEKGTSVFIQTDKPVYKPGQKVHINVIMTGPDLRPVNEKLHLFVEDPHGSRMVQWKDIKPFCCGLVNVSFPLSDQPVLGRWTVLARLQGQTYNRSFEIHKYVLPRFNVAIDPPHFIEDWKTCKPVYVRARYTYGKEVSGDVSVTVSVHGVGYYKDFTSQVAVQHLQISGVVSFNVCVHHLMTHGVGDYFRGVLHIEAEVKTPDGSKVKAVDSSCPVNKHLIDLEFTKDTRRHFKPGLPYKGRLLVFYPDGSPADNVTVRVTTDMHGSGAASKNYMSSQGLIAFTVPSLPTLVQSIWIDAKVVAVGSEPVASHYHAVYMSINSWYSPSTCHILTEPLSHDLQVGDEANFNVHSTCPCNFTMYYEVMARGNLVHSGIHFARHVRRRDVQFEQQGTAVSQEDSKPVEEELGDSKVCSMFLKFKVSHQMAPFSRLLVYYVKPDGEGVADALLFNVKPSYMNKISMDVSSRETLPGDNVQVKVHTTPDSCVCLSGVDKSVHLLKPGFTLSTDEVFQEMEGYDVSLVNEHQLATWWATPHLRHRRRRQTEFWSEEQHTRDAQYAFEECGLLVMTDKVKLHFREDFGSYGGPLYERPGPGKHQVASFTVSHRGLKAQYKARRRKRTFFPETWIWTCFNTSSTQAKETLDVKVPDTITSWQLEGLSVSEKLGLALAQPVTLQTFKHFFVEFTLPYAVIRGEQARIPLTIFNYLHSCVKVHITLHIPDGIQVISSRQNKTSQFTCVGMEETKTLHYAFTFSDIGKYNISVEAVAYSDSRCCSGVLKEEVGDQPSLAQDHVQQTVTSEPEGIPRQYTHSVFFCPNERIHISTPNQYEFQYLQKPGKATKFSFAVKAANDVRIALSHEPHDNPSLYEVVLGGWSNTQSWIARGKEGDKLVSVDSMGIVREDEFDSFWVSWYDGFIKVGWGTEQGPSNLIMSYDTGMDLHVNYIGFSTGWGASGEFKIWRKKDIDGSYGEIFHLGLPPSIIPGSEYAEAKLIGDVLGPALVNLEELLVLPAGCGEQNMAKLASVVSVLAYLTRTHQLTDQLRHQTLDFLTKGYQQQLTYRHQNGAYSGFGERDSSGNTWLTAFVVKCFSQARGFMYVDDKEILRAQEWLVSVQRMDGSFPALGRLINKDIQGGVQGSISLTAYVVVALLEAGGATKLEKSSLMSACRYLEEQVDEVNDLYTAALSMYALSLLRSPKSTHLARFLNNQAIKKDGFTYWLYKESILHSDQLLARADPSKDNKVPKATSAEIEIAAYCLLTLAAQGDVGSALPIVKWLSFQRNTLGGFSSTQDTVIALQALAEYASLAWTGQLRLNVTLASTNMDLQKAFHITEENMDLLQVTRIPSLPAGVFVSAIGDGCALLQIGVHYHVPGPSRADSFQLAVHLIRLNMKETKQNIIKHAQNQDETRNGLQPITKYWLNIQVCTSWLHSGSSNMAVLEVSMLTGFEADPESLHHILHHNHQGLKRYDIQDRKIIFYFDEIRSGCQTCVSFEAFRKHVVGKTQPVPVRIYDYYEPGYEASVFYNASLLSELTRDLCEDEQCNRIMEKTNKAEPEVCGSTLGCTLGEVAAADQCTCIQECSDPGPTVCGSDGVIYPNMCELQRQACVAGVHIEHRFLRYCQQDQNEDSSGETSGEYTSGEIYPLWPFVHRQEIETLTNTSWTQSPGSGAIDNNTVDMTFNLSALNPSPTPKTKIHQGNQMINNTEGEENENSLNSSIPTSSAMENDSALHFENKSAANISDSSERKLIENITESSEGEYINTDMSHNKTSPLMDFNETTTMGTYLENNTAGRENETGSTLSYEQQRTANYNETTALPVSEGHDNKTTNETDANAESTWQTVDNSTGMTDLNGFFSVALNTSQSHANVSEPNEQDFNISIGESVPQSVEVAESVDNNVGKIALKPLSTENKSNLIKDNLQTPEEDLLVRNTTVLENVDTSNVTTSTESQEQDVVFTTNSPDTT